MIFDVGEAELDKGPALEIAFMGGIVKFSLKPPFTYFRQPDLKGFF